MAHVLKITDGTTTIELTDSRYGGVLEYVPRYPGVDVQELLSQVVQGGEMVMTRLRNVDETARIYFKAPTQLPPGMAEGLAPSLGMLRERYAALNTLFRRAEDYNRYRVGSPVEVRLTLDVAGELEWSSRILTGTGPPEESALTWQWVNRKIFFVLTWKRRPWWRAPKQTLTISNANGAWPSAVRLFNNNDGTGTPPNQRINVFSIPSNYVKGDLPVPAILKLKNTTAAAPQLGIVYVGMNWRSNPLTFSHWIEGESAVAGGTTVADANSSGGNYRQFSVTGTEAMLGRWSLPAATLNDAKGANFAVLARLNAKPAWTDMWLRLKIVVIDSTSTLYASDLFLVKSGHTLQPMGEIQLPPGLYNSANAYPLSLEIWGYRASGGTTNLGIDFIQLTAKDGYRVLRPAWPNYGADPNVVIVDDEENGELYTTGWGGVSDTIAHYVGDGSLLLWPGAEHKFTILCEDINGDAPVTRTMEPQLDYYPRRTTL